ncbi:HAD family hydrolase [Actinospica robiniae]|uniref:HAD family hydrolase n=1 Tax=Actinospica robiniae TaxID=304901 RepID=UPI00040BEF0B|nr:HAD hydrolase-like protein [Actinospica robiniae]
MPRLSIGFDLDMTLIDSAAAFKAVLDELSAQTGVFIDSAAAAARLGPPIEDELANWFPPAQVADAVAQYREIYPHQGIAHLSALSGAHQATDAVRGRGGRIVVITGKIPAIAEQCLQQVGLDVDVVVGSVFGAAKGTAIREHDVSAYVGDHPADVLGARAGGAVPVGVATGAFTADQLLDAGAAVVLADLSAFPAWLGTHVSA